MKKTIALVLGGVLAAFGLMTVAMASDVAVVNVDKIFAESAPGKSGAEHLTAVQKVLQEGYDKVVDLYKGKENTQEGATAIAQAQQVLNQQMILERNAVDQVVTKQIFAAVAQWQKKNTKIDTVVSNRLLLGFSPKVDVTDDILKIINTYKPKFADLPKVTVNPPKEK